MSASQSTTNYNLPIFEPNDIPTWLGDWNSTMESIDELIHNASSVSVVQETGTSTEAVMSQAAVSSSLSSIQSALSSGLNGKQNTLVSGTNIKTINNQDLVGGGNLEIQPTYTTTSNGAQTIPASSDGAADWVEINTLSVPNGTYLVIANVAINGATDQAEHALSIMPSQTLGLTRLNIGATSGTNVSAGSTYNAGTVAGICNVTNGTISLQLMRIQSVNVSASQITAIAISAS